VRTLILGGTGMLGHKLWQALRGRDETWVTLRGETARYAHLGLFPADRAIGGVDAGDFDTVVRACEAARPHLVVNCIGVVKQLKAAHDPIVSLTVNALFPHRLSGVCRATGARLIHFSTDCVFSGCKGNYTEADQPDADDLYGRTKLLGEVAGPGGLTLRTSIIGRELSTSTGLTEWFLSHRGGRVQGYRRARFSGLTTRALSDLLVQVIDDPPALTGVYHVASTPITKYDLLCRLNEQFDAKVTIDPADDVQVDRTLDGTRFRTATGWTAPDWNQMIADMSADPTPYDEWRRARVS
jgi:dTDP-4-dehydrorhamnose reductase